MEPSLFLDWETYSEIDIRKHGGKRYAEDESTQAICLGYAFDQEETQLWGPWEPFPTRVNEHVASLGTVYAHNATFDWRIWNNVLRRDFDNIPQLYLEQCIDTAALCQTYTLPASLAKAGEALEINLPKLESGVRLINKCCCPDKNGDQPQYYDNQSTFQELFIYCKRDVDAMRQIVMALPRQELLTLEQKVWEMTVHMNERGLPIDVKAVDAILNYVQQYVKKKMAQVGIVTNGYVNTVGQIKKITEWCDSQGVTLPNLQADTITKAIDDERMPANVKQLLMLRQELGRSSTAKYKKVSELLYNDVVYDNLQYHGTTTGRWAGRGFQMHNLPRAKVDNPEEYISSFIARKNVEDPVAIAKALIRPMIRAPRGQVLIVSDYSSIENRILAWLAGDETTLLGFMSGFDQYIDMASTLYEVASEDVTKDQRQMGKMVVLGCGYMMGVERFIITAAGWGVRVTYPEAQHIIQVYREKYRLIKKLWFRAQAAAQEAILSGSRVTYGKLTFGVAKVNGHRWLAMRVPSGKSIYYKDPTVEPHYIPGYEQMGKVPTVVHSGVNPYTKKWSRLKASPGRITENATQMTAREAMAVGLLNVENNIPEVGLIGTVHDEALGLTDIMNKTPEFMDRFNRELCTVPWIEDGLIVAEGYYSNRYKKG